MQTTILTYQSFFLTFVLIVIVGVSVSGQDSTGLKYLKSFPSTIDSLLLKEDSLYYCSLIQNKKDQVLNLMSVNEVSTVNIKRPELFSNVSKVPSFNGGYIGYASNFRSFIDTPFLEKNIIQHNLSGQLYGRVLGLPIVSTFYIRQTNSSVFNNIYDLQLSLDPAGVSRRLNTQFKNRIDKQISQLEDSLTGKMIAIKQLKANIIREWLFSSFQKQRIIEAREILSVPQITFKPNLSTEENQKREDSVKDKAAKFLRLYSAVDSLYSHYTSRLDSVKNKYQQNMDKVRMLKKLSTGGIGNYSSYLNYKKELEKMDIDEPEVSPYYKHLMAIRNFSLGRSLLNYSELTAKNISINGINAEYNSWYYAALTAGLVDFRFRDFTVNPIRKKQYLAMGRIGIGRLEKNYLIFSAFTGRKQLYASSLNNQGTAAINIKGYGFEAKYSVNQNIYLTGEIAESISPDFRSAQQVNTKPGSRDYSNNAFAVKFVSFYPLAGARMEGFYKYTGSNYQSFSSFQTNSALKTWYAKADKYLFKKVIKLSASLRSNDFSNPYIIQNYNSNTIFKTASFIFRKKGWPVVSGGYMPMSQYTIVDQIATENRFQSVNASLYHLYTVGSARTASTITYNKFMNSGQDSGFIYFNASNIYFSQNIFLGKAIASLGISDTRNSQYECQVFDESLQISFGRVSALTAGVKVNNYNRSEVKVGGYVSTSVKIFQHDVIHFSFERGYLPGLNRQLSRNDMATVQFIKTFGSFNN